MSVALFTMLGRFALACFKIGSSDFSGGLVVKILHASTGDMGLIPGLGRFHILLGTEAHASQLLSSRA